MTALTLTATILGGLALTVPEPRLGTKDPYPQMQPPLYRLIAGGRVRSSIVIAADAGDVERFAADELAGYLQRMSGAQLARGSAPAEGMHPIFLGAAARERLPEVDFDELHEDGFVIRSTGDGLFIAGREELGTLFGVYHLLEKYLGVRWFMPGELGTVVPTTPDVLIGTIDETQEPDFRIRWIESGDWALHNRMNVRVAVNGSPVGINWLWGFHTHFKLVPPEEHFDEHPEYFALVNGVRRRPQPGQQGRQLCLSNPEVVRLMADAVCAKLEEDPTIDILALAPQDGGGFCECDRCRALDEQWPEDQQWHAQYSSRLAWFNNEVARLVRERHPDRLLKVGAYAMYLRVPRDPDYRPEPNLAVQVCHTYSCNNHRVAEPTCERNREMFTRELNHWAEIADHLFIYEYYNKGVWGGLPYPQAHVIRWDIPYYHDLGAEAFYTQAAGRRFPVIGLNHYIAAKLVWDSDLDVDAVLQDFYERFYREAAGPMGRYWERLEAAFSDNPHHLSPFGLEWTTLSAPKLFTPEVLADLDEAVTEAERFARSEDVRGRVHQARLAVDFTTMVMDYLTTMQAQFEGVDRGDEEAVQAAYERAVELGEPMSEEIVQYCRDNGLPVFDRLVRAHTNRRFIMPRPEDETLLR